MSTTFPCSAADAAAGRLRRLGLAVSCIARTLLAAMALAGAAAWPTHAVEVEIIEKRVDRDIIVLFDSAAERRAHETRVHQFAEMPLNYLGYRLTYADIRAPLPDAEAMKGVKAVLSWFLEPMEAARAGEVVRWLDDATRQGVRHIVLGEMAPGTSEADAPALRRLHARLGLDLTDEYIDITIGAKVLAQDRAVVGFERPLDKVLPDFPVLRPMAGKAAPHLLLEAETRDGPQPSAVVSTSPGGGLAAGSYTIYFEQVTDRVLWVVNPFAFFERALGGERMPVPDPTTLAGRRIYVSHIDGDGWNNLTEVEPYREQERSSTEVIAEEAIVPYPDLPVSVAIIGGDVEPSLGGSSTGQAVARLLYALPQVEVASHTYTHPYNWSFFERYDRGAEEQLIAKHQKPSRPVREQLTEVLSRVAGREPPRGQYNPYVAGTDDLPRTYLREPFDLGKEVGGALRLAERYAPPGKRARIYQWSGDTTPFEAALAAVREAGAVNINGGDSRLDREFPSVAYVPPVGRAEGRERQIYAANSNENTYTNDWTGPYYGFFLLEETLKNTESPRRLKPFNLYYHMYSGEKAAALAAVRHFLEMARRSPVIPIHASEYAAIAGGFYTTEIRKIDTGRWEVTGRGALQTVRFDAADALALDLASSRGVFGAVRTNGALYIALDPAAETSLVALKPFAQGASEASGRELLLLESRWQVRDRREEECGLAFTASGFGAGDMRWRTGAGRAFHVSMSRGARVLSEEIVRADAEGYLRLRLEHDALDPVAVRFVCHE